MKNVIITGAANGVGKSVAEILKDENLILLDRDKERLLKIADELNKDYCVSDLSNTNQINKVVAKITEKYNKVDCLINCAGMWIPGEMSKLELPIFDEMNTLDRIQDDINTNVFDIPHKITIPSIEVRPIKNY